MDVYENGYYRFVRKNLSRVGLWPYDDPKLRKVRRNFFGFVLFLSLFLQITGFLLLPFDMKLFFKFIMRISPSMFCSLFYILFIHKEKEIRKLFDRIRVEFQMRNTEERKIVKCYADEAKLSSLVLFYAYVILLIVLISPQVLSALKRTPASNETRIRNYPISVGYFENIQSYYLVILISLYVILLIEGTVCIGTWNVYTHFVNHVCAMLRVTGHMLERVLDERTIKFEDDKNKTHDALVQVINYHNDCLRFLNDLNTICESSFLLHMVFTITVTSMDVLYLTDIKYMVRDYNELLLYMILIGSHFFVLFTGCYLGQNVLNHGVDLHKKTYTFPWYVTPPKIQRMCLLMMIKSAEPLYLSIGKMFMLSYEFLVMVLNTSISYAMVFHSR